MSASQISVLLADDNLIVREGVRALLQAEPDLNIVGAAADYDELIAKAIETEPQVLVTDIRMPPAFATEGIDAARELRKRQPGIGIVVLSQYDDPEYAISLLAEGAFGCAYLLKNRIAEGDQLARAVRTVAIGGSLLDPHIADSLVRPVAGAGELNDRERDVLREMAEGRSIKSIAATQKTTPSAVADQIDAVLAKLALGVTGGARSALKHLHALHQAIVEREEHGRELSRFLPGGLAEKLRRDGHGLGRTERLDVTVLMSDVRGYSTIAESSDPGTLCGQLSEHRDAMSRAILDVGGTVMAFIGDAVMGVFGAPVKQPGHAGAALTAARAMLTAQKDLNLLWARRQLPAFPIGIGLSTGEVAAATLGSEERMEYTVIGDTVNLAQRLQQWAAGGEIVASEATLKQIDHHVDSEALEPATVKGRAAPVTAFRIREG